MDKKVPSLTAIIQESAEGALAGKRIGFASRA